MNAVAQHLAATNKTQRQLADEIGVSQPTVSDWAAGKKRPDGDSIVRLARALGVSPGQVLDSFHPEFSVRPAKPARRRPH